MQAELGAVYSAKVADGSLRADPGQASVVAHLDELARRLAGYVAETNDGSRFSRLLRRSKEPAPTGLYLWGGVGRGKSMLMDLFFEHADVALKRRVHFHAFMQEIQDGLGEARASGERDPVETVARSVIEAAHLLCFDELQVTDIADAMIVGRLFEKLFAAGVVVVTTSNRVPEDLYKDGLNRKLFLPFIDLIQEKLKVVEIAAGDDHRRAVISEKPVYFSPPDRAAMDGLWQDLTGGGGEALVLVNKGRQIEIPVFANGVGRMSFAEICQVPLGPSDYLLLTDRLSVLMIDDVPVMTPAQNAEAKRFGTLVDAAYEAGKTLVISADAPADELYQKGTYAFEFERTASRLIEMQTPDWAEKRN